MFARFLDSSRDSKRILLAFDFYHSQFPFKSWFKSSFVNQFKTDSWMDALKMSFQPHFAATDTLYGAVVNPRVGTIKGDEFTGARPTSILTHLKVYTGDDTSKNPGIIIGIEVSFDNATPITIGNNKGTPEQAELTLTVGEKIIGSWVNAGESINGLKIMTSYSKNLSVGKVWKTGLSTEPCRRYPIGLWSIRQRRRNYFFGHAFSIAVNFAIWRGKGNVWH